MAGNDCPHMVLAEIVQGHWILFDLDAAFFC
jgi:hypothetical protein